MNCPISLKIAVTLLFPACFAMAADADPAGNTSLKDLLDAAKAAPVFAAPNAPERAAAVKEWTIMVFMNGKNDLHRLTMNDLNEMEQAGVPENVNLVVEAGRAYINPNPPPNPYNPYGIPNIPGIPGMLGRAPAPMPAAAAWSGIRRYLIQKDADPAEVTSPVLEEFKGDMGDWNHLAEFGLWAKGRFPARRYMLVVWNHGSGWKSAEVFTKARGISYDDETGRHITGVQLGQALAKMGGVDIYASDACLMQMAEVAYELRNSAPLIIGSEETEPAEGWPYHYFLSGLSGAALTPENIASAAVRGFSRYYSEKTKKTTISAVYTRDLAALKTLTDQWAALAIASGDHAGIKAARNDTKTFADAESKDLLHFMSLAAERTTSRELKIKSGEIANLLSSRIILYNSTTGDAQKNAYGLGIYMPYSIPDTAYRDLGWAKGGKWFEFINWIQG